MTPSSALTHEPALGVGLIRIDIPNCRAAPGRARAWLAGPVRGSHPGRAEDVLLCLSEAVTNVHRHTTAAVIRIDTVITTLSVLVRVHDDRPAPLDRAPGAGVEAEGGRGLTLIDACADAWGVTYLGGSRPTGKAVWFSVAREPDGAAGGCR
ncbi:ATP-binding protein [Streptomyces sp. NPDC014894]|uniref:ATP-binding protein n=1 Tax=unclassified Streptomyces TaxID=2593676 RepID=UPI0036FD2B8E